MLGIVSNDLMTQCTREITGFDVVLSGFFSSIGIWPNHHVTEEMREKAREVESAPVDKSELTLVTAKRLRDGTHLRFVASLPCLVCGRTPSQAHHLRFAQLRSMGSKVSDEWTVPLCITHHRSLHDVGIEEDWWREQEIDAKTEATKLWQQHRQPELSSETKDASSASASATGTAA